MWQLWVIIHSAVVPYLSQQNMDFQFNLLCSEDNINIIAPCVVFVLVSIKKKKMEKNRWRCRPCLTCKGSAGARRVCVSGRKGEEHGVLGTEGRVLVTVSLDNQWQPMESILLSPPQTLAASMHTDLVVQHEQIGRGGANACTLFVCCMCAWAGKLCDEAKCAAALMSMSVYLLLQSQLSNLLTATL